MNLADIDPDALGLEVAAAVSALPPATLLRGRSWLGKADDPAASPLARAVAELTRYAQTGEAPWGDDPTAAWDAAQDVSSVVHALTPDRGQTYVPDLRQEADPSTPIGLVLVAANARAGRAMGRELTPLELDTLSGFSG